MPLSAAISGVFSYSDAVLRFIWNHRSLVYNLIKHSALHLRLLAVWALSNPHFILCFVSHDIFFWNSVTAGSRVPTGRSYALLVCAVLELWAAFFLSWKSIFLNFNYCFGSCASNWWMTNIPCSQYGFHHEPQHQCITPFLVFLQPSSI